MHRLALVPEAAAEAARFAVAPEIHADDFIFAHHFEIQPDAGSADARARVAEYYFADGDRSTGQLDRLVREHHPEAGSRRLSLLEFASGYGCVSRHLRKLDDRYELLACDIHPQAVAFLEQRLGVRAMPSHSVPEDVAWPRAFDVVFALSFFSHMPPRSFGAWLRALYAALAPGGVLIFTTHGREAYCDLHRPPLTEDQHWFLAESEQKDLPADEYGTMVATPRYVVERIERCPGAALLAFRQAAWWGKQDLFVVGKTDVAFPPTSERARELAAREWREREFDLLARRLAHAQRENAARKEALDVLRRSASWRLTAPLRGLTRLFRPAAE